MPPSCGWTLTSEENQQRDGRLNGKGDLQKDGLLTALAARDKGMIWMGAQQK